MLRARRSSSLAATARQSRCLARLVTAHPPARKVAKSSASRATVLKVVAFQTSTPSGKEPTSPPVAPSRPAWLAQLNRKLLKNVYGVPLTKSELSALEAAVQHWSGQLAGPVADTSALRQQLLSYLQEVALNKTARLDVVEGSMALLEQLHLQEAPVGAVAKVGGAAPQLKGNWTAEEMRDRWQLVIGADVGGIQYIPVTEIMSVEPPSFSLDADMGVIYMGFSGEAAWLSPGHVRYTSRRVRLELRLPEEWERGLAFLRWRSGQARLGARHYNEREQPPLSGTQQDGPGRDRCRADPTKPAITLPVPIPTNELFCFASNGTVAPVRSSLGGLILLLNKSK